MKRFILFLACAAALIAATGCNSNKYSITGKFDYPEGAKSVLVSLVNDELSQIVDTLRVTEGSYSFSGVVDTPYVAHIEYARGGNLLVVEGGRITITEDGATGTEQNDLLTAANKAVKEHPVIIEVKDMMARGMAGDTSVSPEKIMKKMKEAEPELLGLYEKIIEEHPAERAAVVSLYMLGNVCVDDDGTLLKKYSDMLSEENRRNPFVADMVKMIDAATAMRPGAMFKDFTVEDGTFDGTPASMSDYVGKGKYVLVDFWASWCQPCKEEIPLIKKVYKKYKGDDFTVLGVAVWDDRDASLKTIEELGMTWNQILNSQRVAVDAYGMVSIPQILLFGPDGKLLEVGLRGEAIEAAVAKYVKAKNNLR